MAKNTITGIFDRPTKMTNGVLKFKHVDKKEKPYFFYSDLNKEIPKFLCVDKDDCYDYQIKD